MHSQVVLLGAPQHTCTLHAMMMRTVCIQCTMIFFLCTSASHSCCCGSSQNASAHRFMRFVVYIYSSCYGLFVMCCCWPTAWFGFVKNRHSNQIQLVLSQYLALGYQDFRTLSGCHVKMNRSQLGHQAIGKKGGTESVQRNIISRVFASFIANMDT